MLSGESSRQLILPNPSTGLIMVRMAKVQVVSSILQTLVIQLANKSQLQAKASMETREIPSQRSILKEPRISLFNLYQRPAHLFSRKISRLLVKLRSIVLCVDNRLKIKDLFIRDNTRQLTLARAQLVSIRQLRKVMSQLIKSKELLSYKERKRLLRVKDV